MRIKHFYLLILSLITAVACTNSTSNTAVHGNFYTPRYAKGFCIDTLKGTKVLHVFNPFQHSKKVSFNYSISLDSTIKRAICMSTTHVAFINLIDKTESIVGLAGADFLYDSILHQRYANGAIADVGYDTKLNIEKVLSLQPDVIFAYGISGEFTSVASKLEELGLRVVYIGEYTEEHPLGKAEWAIAMAAFFNRESLAIDKFTQVANEYEQLKKLASTATSTTKVLLNAPWNDAWFVPGMHGNMATLLHDAGGTSVIPLRSNRDSYPINIERAYGSAQEATVWLNPGQAKNSVELKNMHKLIENIPAFKQGEIYNNNARLNKYGGNDFFESGTVCPHIILKDLIKILHPELLPQYQMVYYRKLQ